MEPDRDTSIAADASGRGAIPEDIRPVEPGYRSSLRLRAALRWGVLIVVTIVADSIYLSETPFAWWPSLAAAALAIGEIFLKPQRTYHRLGYAIDDRLLRVVSGWLFNTDTIVPFVRVQHIDVTRGPIDRMFGIANLVVHTAGTHNSVVVLPGLSPETAAAIRDRIGAEIRADWE